MLTMLPQSLALHPPASLPFLQHKELLGQEEEDGEEEEEEEKAAQPPFPTSWPDQCAGVCQHLPNPKPAFKASPDEAVGWRQSKQTP